MKNNYLKVLVFFTCCSFQINAQQTPAPAQTEIISIVGATAHIGNGELIENATLILENGIIRAIGETGTIQAEGAVVDAKGKHIYPGFIIPSYRYFCILPG